MTDEKKKKIIKWYWILLTAPFLALFILLCIVWAFADIPSIEQLEAMLGDLTSQIELPDALKDHRMWHAQHTPSEEKLYQRMLQCWGDRFKE